MDRLKIGDRVSIVDNKNSIRIGEVIDITQKKRFFFRTKIMYKVYIEFTDKVFEYTRKEIIKIA